MFPISYIFLSLLFSSLLSILLRFAFLLISSLPLLFPSKADGDVVEVLSPTRSERSLALCMSPAPPTPVQRRQPEPVAEHADDEPIPFDVQQELERAMQAETEEAIVEPLVEQEAPVVSVEAGSETAAPAETEAIVQQATVEVGAPAEVTSTDVEAAPTKADESEVAVAGTDGAEEDENLSKTQIRNRRRRERRKKAKTHQRSGGKSKPLGVTNN